MPDRATFTGPDGQPAGGSIRQLLQVLTTPTVGDLLFVGQVFRSRIRRRTEQGIDVNGAAFVPYSTRPYYFYPNRDSAGNNREARATVARGRFNKTGRLGKRTPLGIRYEGGYAEAKAAHGRPGVDLYGLEQHVHMLDTMMVRAGGVELSAEAGEFLFGDATEIQAGGLAAATELNIGFYGPEWERAKGNNEGTATIPKREFFALNDQDLRIGEQGIAERMIARGNRTANPSQAVADMQTGPITLDDVGF